MLYTRKEEIAQVRENLCVFDGKLPRKLVTELLKVQYRQKQHGLFYSLSCPSVYPSLLKALTDIKSYKQGKYFPKAIKKLIGAHDWHLQMTAVSEIIAVGYYCCKYQNNSKFEVIWERRLLNGKSNVDISVTGLKVPINIEITALGFDAKQKYFFDTRFEIKDKIDTELSKITTPKYILKFSLNINIIPENIIDKFATFAIECRHKGEGRYNFSYDNNYNGFVIVEKVSKSPHEFSFCTNPYSAILQDDSRIREKIIEKINTQLPEGEVNFVCISNLGMFDYDDYVDALFGKEQWTYRGRQLISVSRTKRFPNVSGVIYFKWDFSEKKVFYNPSLTISKQIQNVVS